MRGRWRWRAHDRGDGVLSRALPPHPAGSPAATDPRPWRSRSEFPPGFFQPQRWCFIASQRIIAALADVLVIVEAGGFTYAALTTKIATELGRDIAVVPGRVTDPSGDRILRLLQDGAHPVATAEDVLEVIHGAGRVAPRSTTRRCARWRRRDNERPRAARPAMHAPRSTNPPCKVAA